MSNADKPRVVATRWWWVRHAPVREDGGCIYGQDDLGCDTSDLGSGNMDTFFDTRRDQVFVDESIDPVAPKIVLSPQGTLFKKWNLIAEGDLQIGPYHEDRALGFARKKLLHI